MNTGTILAVAKKNGLSIACGGVALVAVIAAFFPVGNFVTDLQTEVTKRAALWSVLTGLISKPRNLPLTDPAATTPDPLNQFPTDPAINAAAEATHQVSLQSTQMVEMLVKLNQWPHPLLVPDALPAPNSDFPKFHFRDLYKLVLSNDPTVSIKTNADLAASHQLNLWNDVLHGGIPPTQAEITAKTADMYETQFKMLIRYVNGQEDNKTEVDAAFKKASDLLPTQMKNDVAMQKKIYINPDALAINPNVIGAVKPDPNDMWIAQLDLWIQKDVADALALANANSANILDAPVKRLIKLSIPLSPPYTMASGGMGPVAPGAPGAAVARTPLEGGDIATLPKFYNISPTGRACNPMYDVVQFALVVDVQASQIPYVLECLSKDRLIDVYNMDEISIDYSEQQLQGFIYGSQPVIRLNLKCEALFMRTWSVPLMPPGIRILLNVADPAPAQPTTPAALAQ